MNLADYGASIPVETPQNDGYPTDSTACPLETFMTNIKL